MQLCYFKIYFHQISSNCGTVKQAQSLSCLSNQVNFAVSFKDSEVPSRLEKLNSESARLYFSFSKENMWIV